MTALCDADSAAFVSDLGADAVYDYRQKPPAALSGRFDCFFDVFGNQSYWRMRDRLRPRGRYVTTVPSPANIRDHALTLLWPGRTARLVVVKKRREALEQIARWVESGKLRPVVATVLPLSVMREAHVQIQAPSARTGRSC